MNPLIGANCTGLKHFFSPNDCVRDEYPDAGEIFDIGVKSSEDLLCIEAIIKRRMQYIGNQLIIISFILINCYNNVRV